MAVYHHITTTGHQFQDKDILILDKGVNWFKRGAKEGIYEWIQAPSVNKTGGLGHSSNWSWGPGATKGI